MITKLFEPEPNQVYSHNCVINSCWNVSEANMGDEDVEKTEVLFRALNADDPEATEIESLCMECGENVIQCLMQIYVISLL
jgi:hypothetical protein